MKEAWTPCREGVEVRAFARRADSVFWSGMVSLLFHLLAGCGTVEFEAPPGARVRILKLDEPAAVKLEQKIWYAGWGEWPLSNNSTAPLIAQGNLKEVRMATDQNLLDTIISTVTSILSFSIRTMYVEGNPGTTAPPGTEKLPDQGAATTSGM